jgi:hypothetical protein
MEFISMEIEGLEDIIDDINKNVINDSLKLNKNDTNNINDFNKNQTDIYFGSMQSVCSPIGCGGSNYNFTPGVPTIEFKFNPF